MGGPAPNLRDPRVWGDTEEGPWVDRGPQAQTKKATPMGGRKLAGTRPPSIKG